MPLLFVLPAPMLVFALPGWVPGSYRLVRRLPMLLLLVGTAIAVSIPAIGVLQRNVWTVIPATLLAVLAVMVWDIIIAA